MREEYHSKNVCLIDRDNENYPRQAVLFDEEGNLVFSFDADFTDAQIWQALEFANQAYRVGFSTGEYRKMNEIRRALSCTHEDRSDDIESRLDKLEEAIHRIEYQARRGP